MSWALTHRPRPQSAKVRKSMISAIKKHEKERKHIFVCVILFAESSGTPIENAILMWFLSICIMIAEDNSIILYVYNYIRINQKKGLNQQNQRFSISGCDHLSQHSSTTFSGAGWPPWNWIQMGNGIRFLGFGNSLVPWKSYHWNLGARWGLDPRYGLTIKISAMTQSFPFLSEESQHVSRKGKVVLIPLMVQKSPTTTVWMFFKPMNFDGMKLPYQLVSLPGFLVAINRIS